MIRTSWRNAKQWGDHVYEPRFGSLPVAAIDTGLVMQSIDRFGPRSPRRRVACAVELRSPLIGPRLSRGREPDAVA